MTFTHFVGKLLHIENVSSIERWDLSFAAPWANRGPAWVLFGCLALCALSALFYVKYQSRGRPSVRKALAIGRAALLCILLVVLAEPILVIKLTNHPRPWLWVLFDGTDSMAIEDEYSERDRSRLAEAVGLTPETMPPGASLGAASPAAAKLSRVAYVRALLQKKDDNLLQQLGDKFRFKFYVFDRPDGVREMKQAGAGNKPLDVEHLAAALTTTGQVTALGKAFEDLSLRHATSHLAGVLAFSDFDQNSGPPPLAAAKRLGVPVYTVGIGSEAAMDLAVDLRAPLLMKKAEKANLAATLRQTGLTDREVNVKLTARRIDGSNTVDDSFLIGEKNVRLTAVDQPVEFTYSPTETGRFVLTAEVEPQQGELVDQNNRAQREVNIRDDFLRLMFVEYEPTWEWRFVKEVFHRDKLVGMRGFRTFLRSADPNVRKTNELFLSTLTPKRSEFFANDVIFLGDMPAATLSSRFCEMTKEFVSKFGGGLVVLGGSRFGPAQLASTPLADMLPVVVDPAARPRDDHAFLLQLTADAAQYDFMQLGADAPENAKAWSNLGPLPWYQPVSRLHPFGTALAVHPTDKCVDGTTPQPIIAVRRYGRGEVIYIGFNETWRLRRKFGELYYRQFWGQMIHRLGLSHALGSQKRFVVRTDRQQYQADDKVLLTVEAYDANFEPLTDENLPQHKLTAELTLPVNSADGKQVQELSIPQLREGVFEARIPVLQGGEHRVAVNDPITGEHTDVYFQVTNVAVERRSAVRNLSLQREIAVATGGQTYDLGNVASFVQDFQPPQLSETSVRVEELWSTWLCFGLVVVLMLGEWLVRKLVSLP